MKMIGVFIFAGVLNEELTSSKLQAPCYDEAGKYVLIPYPLSPIPFSHNKKSRLYEPA